MKEPRFHLFRDAAGEWRWNLRAKNGRIIATSGEGYHRERAARAGIAAVRGAHTAILRVHPQPPTS